MTTRSPLLRRIALALLLLRAIAWPAPVRAAAFDGPNSTLEIVIGGLPRVSVTSPGDPGFIYLRNGVGGHYVSIYGSVDVWRTYLFELGTEAFADIPQISNAFVNAAVTTGFVANGSYPPTTNPLGGGAPIGFGMRGYMHIWGSLVLQAMDGSVQKQIPNTFGWPTWGTSMNSFQGYPITRSWGPVVTPPLQITGITSNRISIPARGNVQGVAFSLQPTPAESVRTPSTNGGFVSLSGGAPVVEHTVTISGTQNLISADSGGTVTLVTPLRIRTGDIAGSLPGVGRYHFQFVPEPDGTLLLIVGLAGLCVLAGRRRRR